MTIEKIFIPGKHICVVATGDRFSVRDLDTRYDPPKMYSPWPHGKRSSKKFYAWADRNRVEIKTMTFDEASDAMDREKIKVDSC